MNVNWIEFSRDSYYEEDSNYPPEGVDVAVTDGESIDIMWMVYSGGAEWCWYDPTDIDGSSDSIPFEPTHWLSPEYSVPYIREKQLKMLLEH